MHLVSKARLVAPVQLVLLGLLELPEAPARLVQPELQASLAHLEFKVPLVRLVLLGPRVVPALQDLLA